MFQEKSSKCSKNLASVKITKEVFWKTSKYRNTVFYDFKSRFLGGFFSNYRHRLVLKIPFPDHIFPNFLKYRTENLHFPSTSKYCVPPHWIQRALVPHVWILQHLKNTCLKEHLRSTVSESLNWMIAKEIYLEKQKT